MSLTQSHINSFAIIGVGEIGLPIAKELLANKHDVRVFTRTGSTNPSVVELEIKGARRIEVDYNSDESIEAALQGGVDVIISTIGEAAVDGAQARVARVASEVGGVQLFISSQWGFDYTSPAVTEPRTFNPSVSAKAAFHTELEALGLPWIAISNGLFSSWSFMSGFGIQSGERKAELKVDGEKQVTFTNLADIARFVHQVVTTRSLPQPGSGRWYFVEGYKANFNSILAEAQRIDGDDKPWTISQAVGAVEQARSRRQELSERGVLSWVLSTISDGLGSREHNDNDEIAFKPIYGFRESVKEALETSRQK